ncbi:hypothetical protein HHK36_015031 [Tetracentron sinense]|uniref:NAC domain-containing protein n=1 Tax=Tetracentron sinense TaxID=13715 RepID=A0A835DDG9_TETSI|nr:hypothetical protein HHK36_015031 [Tetracentron sinense]
MKKAKGKSREETKEKRKALDRFDRLKGIANSINPSKMAGSLIHIYIYIYIYIYTRNIFFPKVFAYDVLFTRIGSDSWLLTVIILCKLCSPSWLVDSKRIATKIKSASETCDPRRVRWKSNPTRACPKCNHVIDNSDVSQEWPGLPRGVKFDPSDQEIIWHLLAKVGAEDVKPHPFIDEFIPTVDNDDGICYAHPQDLPGVKQDGSVSHFFHRAIKAYNTGTRKRRKIHGDDLCDVRWHKTGKTKPVILDGIQKGCKKIMVLYMSMVRGGKPEKTNWVMHQYNIGIGEDEDGEFVISKIFYQKQAKQSEKIEQDLLLDIMNAVIANVDPVTPKSVIPEPPRAERQCSDICSRQEPALYCMDLLTQVQNMSSILKTYIASMLSH